MTSLRIWRLAALILSSLSVGMKLAHALETPGKLALDYDTFVVTQGSLYDLFAIIGPVLDVGALVAVGVLAWRSRGLASFRFVRAQFGLIVASLVTWALVVMPATASIRAMTTGDAPLDWESVRASWQFGQLGTFVLEFVGFVLLAFALVFRASELPRK